MIVVVMGVSGAGKSTIGAALAAELGWRFLDADEFHPPQNVAKMAAGMPLADADRWPWLDLLNGKLRAIEKAGESAVLACSALKTSYRERLAAGIGRCEIVYLRGGIELIRERLARRSHRYMPASLLESQFATLEPPTHAIAVDIGGEPSAAVASIIARLPR